MKKSLKGIVLASLISTQVLTAPISAFAVTADTSENSEQVGLENTSESIEEDVVPDTTEEKLEETGALEIPAQEETVETVEEESTEIPVPEVTPETTETPTEEQPVAVASEAKKQLVKDTVANAQAILDEGTYMAETTIPLRAAMSAAMLLLDQAGVTDEQLDAAIIEVNEKVAGLVKAETELSFVRNLVMAINEATQIINNTDDFKDMYTPASVAAKKASIETAVEAGKNVLAEVVDVEGNIVLETAVDNRGRITAAAEAIISAIHGGNGLVRRDQLSEILLEASRLQGAKVASDADKVDFETALKQAENAFDNALSDAEADAAVSALRTAMDNLRLVVVVSAVDENGNLIMNQADTSVSGLYKKAWSVEPPVIEGYEYVSSNNRPVSFARTAGQAISGTFGDGTNDVTFVYKLAATVLEPPYKVPAPIQPAVGDVTNNLLNNTTNNTSETYHPKKNLPKTGEKTSSIANFGLLAIAAGTLAFFKKRKIEE